jgi:hypothetical protein
MRESETSQVGWNIVMYVARLICCVHASWLRVACAIGLRERCVGRGGITPQQEVVQWHAAGRDASCSFPSRKFMGVARKQIEWSDIPQGSLLGAVSSLGFGRFSPPSVDHATVGLRKGPTKKKYYRRSSWMFICNLGNCTRTVSWRGKR